MKTRLEVAVDLLRQGRLADAKARLVKELRLAPQSVPALELLGAVTSEMGKHGEAIEYLRRAARLAPSSPGPSLNLGRALFAGGLTVEAADTLRNAVGRWPNIPEARVSYGNVLFTQGQTERAVEEYRAAIRLNPKQVSAYPNLALALFALQEYGAVCDACERLLKLEPGSATGELLLTMSRQMLCAWDGHEARLARLAKLAEQGHIAHGLAHSSLLLWDDAALHRRCADLQTGLHRAQAKAPSPPKFAMRGKGRIHIAYVSADYRAHPIARLVASLIEGHDRERFEVSGISLGKDDSGAERQRLVRAFDRFLDMRDASTDAIVQEMRKMEVDIAVDLMGHTQDGRPAIFLSRVAPVQVNYIGFAATSAIDGIDYWFVDRFVAGSDVRRAASEKLVILPDCYYANDALQATPAAPPSRASCGLPGGAFVFCSFNQRKKFTPDVFERWMRILHQVEGSVLWLLKPPDQAAANLRGEAQRRGVDPRRIIFADRVGNDLHLARNGLADLHLDTFPYNAHTTASDALRAGSPILTRAGTSFASRVCGSMLTTIGVTELIANSAEEYEALAVRLARDKAMLADLRRRIEHGRAHSPLFDTARLCRNMERAYEAMLARARAGQPPAEIDVGTLTDAPLSQA